MGLLVGSFFIFSKVFSASSDIIINEIGAYPTSTHEWVEIWNKGTSTVDILGWKFLESAGGTVLKHGVSMASSTTSTLVYPGEYCIVAQNSDQFLEDMVGFAPKVFDSSWSVLSESGEEVGLEDALGTVVERFVYVTSSNFSLERKDPFLNDYTSFNWQEHPSSNTIGYVNSNFSTSTVTSTPPDPPPDRELIWSHIKINEIVPNPENGNEWVELYNPTTSSLDMAGGTLCDNRTPPNCIIAFTTGTVQALGWLVVEIGGNKLNNTGDAVILKNPSSTIVDQIVYSGELLPKEGQALVRKIDGIDMDTANDWALTTSLTPGATNVIVAPPTPPSPGPSSSNVPYSPPPINNPAAETLPSVYSSLPKKIVINEFYPNPPGADVDQEFVELKNNSTETINLDGWKIGNATKIYALKNELEANELLVLPRSETGIVLKNSSEELVRLYSKDFIVDEVGYDHAPEAQSYSRNNEGILQWTGVITSGLENVFVGPSSTQTHTSSTYSVVSTSTIASPEKYYDEYKEVEISEVFPNPEGVDAAEFVELHNFGFETINLGGWKLRTQKGKEYIMPSSTMIMPGGYLLFDKSVTKLTLGNTEEAVLLFDNENYLISVVVIPKSVSGKSYNLIQGSWYWANPNPLTMLLIPPEQIQQVSEARNPSIKKSNSRSIKKSVIPRTLSLLEVQQAQPGELVKVRGTVSVVPNIFGSQYFYISNETNGIKIYQNKKDFPELKIGQQVEVSGVISVANNTKRINVKNGKDIKVFPESMVLTPQQSDIQNLNDDSLGAFVQIEGDITEIKTNFMYVDDGESETQVYFKKGAKIDKSKFKEGEKVQVVGIVERGSSGLQLWPRSLDDIKVIRAQENSAPTPDYRQSEQLSEGGGKKYVEVSVGGVGAVLLGWLMRARGLVVVGALRGVGKKVVGVFRKNKV
jgi:DNA/RNA endonuclease YhcR with UshA esterase domain